MAATVALLTAVISVLLTAFAWPVVRSSVHDVPIALAGPAAATDRVAAALEQRQPGAFDVVRVPDTAAAERAVRDREVYGAIDLSTGAPQVIIASAGSPVVAQALQGVAAGLGGQAGGVPVRDLAPLPSDDPRGAGLGAAALPLVIGGLLAAFLITSRVRGTARRVVGALAFAVTGGLAMAALMQFWLGSIDGNYLANAGVIALSVAATALTLLGLESLLGTAGLGIGAALMMLVGNPLSGATSAPQMLPGRSGDLGQLLPPGASGALLRSTAFFDGHAANGPLAVLLVWSAVGVVLCVAGGFRARRAGAATDAPPDTAPVSPSPAPA
ncbi:membrane protein [Virgisporangium aliadipatigenens]|uniref:Membrane protein n=1 Tax=Virgisporangium aliadipatigenens TaxID=741659 RepID=A0A8J3YHR1_9ACTN|nr:membrane protein [Virgisporangium aliadipatigenens]